MKQYVKYMNICPTKKKPVQKKCSKNIKDKNSNLPSEPQPGPFGLSKNIKTSFNPKNKKSKSCLTSSEDESDKCCLCGKFTPDEVRQRASLIFTKWVACDRNGCDHWVHLNCSTVNVIRRGAKFFCHHCSYEE